LRSGRLHLFLLGALAAVASACGAPTHVGEPSLQTRLRALAIGAPAGDRAYWLGPHFGHTPLRFANASWGRYAIVTYHRLDTGIDIDVETFRSRAAGQAEGFRVRVRTATGQDVVILFHAPARPGAALIRKARAALVPIPPRVTVP
jgi:hypothetical protein